MKTNDLMLSLMAAFQPNSLVTREAVIDVINQLEPAPQANGKNLPLQTLLMACARAGVGVRAVGGTAGVGTTKWDVSYPPTAAALKLYDETKAKLKRERARHSALHHALGAMGYELRSRPNKLQDTWEWTITPPAAYRIKFDANGIDAADQVYVAGHKYFSEASLQRSIKAMYNTRGAQLLCDTFATEIGVASPGEYNDWEKRVWTRGFDDCKVQYADLVVAKEKLANFKRYVHKRLDDAGVPHDDPTSLHSVAGCRVGARLDIALQGYASAQRTMDRFQNMAAALAANDIAFEELPTKTVLSMPPLARGSYDGYRELVDLVRANHISLRVGDNREWVLDMPTHDKERADKANARHTALMAQLQILNVRAEWNAGEWKVTLPAVVPPVPKTNASLQQDIDRLVAQLKAKDAYHADLWAALSEKNIVAYSPEFTSNGKWDVRLPIQLTPFEGGIDVQIYRGIQQRNIVWTVRAGDMGYDLIYRLYTDTLPRPAKA